MAMEKAGLMKSLTIWLGSFMIVAIALFFYFHVSLQILLFAGIGTFLVTLLRYFLARRHSGG